eukprot:scaffold1072_cov356-Prasinococcus_capsulatus_cf.AAC.1
MDRQQLAGEKAPGCRSLEAVMVPRVGVWAERPRRRPPLDGQGDPQGQPGRREGRTRSSGEERPAASRNAAP